ncbi:hypothetical protein SAY86_030648 [Trapa natans]|uniref:Secreted protein n=1 Tax=Trapa natans TaxID=22666 RepID=A0AAN7MGB6_TRANT|nr:hypothetical protein SAY86_030648 [Trapa natans]
MIAFFLLLSLSLDLQSDCLEDRVNLALVSDGFSEVAFGLTFFFVSSRCLPFRFVGIDRMSIDFADLDFFWGCQAHRFNSWVLSICDKLEWFYVIGTMLVGMKRLSN